MVSGLGRECCGRNSVLCILPPHILNSIAVNAAKKEIRQKVLDTLITTSALTSARVAINESGRSWLSAATRPWGAMATAALPHKNRTIYTANHTQRLPGTVVRREGDTQSSGDVAVDEAYEYMGDTFDFYWDIFERDSIDDNGMALNGSVHFGRDYDNAYWDGQRMVYGDGDGELFERFTKCVDVIGHELTHGVTQYEAGLIYWAQTGALNESVSDVFGSLVKQYVLGQKARDADWLIGQGLLAPGVNGVAIRSMIDPGSAYDDPVLGKDPQPGHMRDYVSTLQDNGGVHINSGIPNKAFQLAATNIGGHSWDGAGLIWYETLLSPMLRRNSQFKSFARLTVSTAQQLFPGGSEAEAVREAWGAVGINV